MYGYSYQYGRIIGKGSNPAAAVFAAYKTRVLADGGVVENDACAIAFLESIGAGIIPSFSFLLDDYSGAAAAYSLRKLRNAYSGDAIRVRRLSDNAELNIGFVANELDTAALTTFASGTDAFVTTWYNQATGANHAVQTTAANQPKIVSSGALVTTNGKVSIDFDGTNDSFVINNEATWLGSYTNLCIADVFKMDAVTNRTLYNSKTFVAWTDGSNTRVVINSVALTRQVFSFGIGSQYLSFLNGSSSAVDRHINNSLNADGIVASLSVSTANTYIGSYVNGSLSFMFDGTRQEIIIWKADQSANRVGIQNNINSYYGIY